MDVGHFKDINEDKTGKIVVWKLIGNYSAT